MKSLYEVVVTQPGEKQPVIYTVVASTIGAALAFANGQATVAGAEVARVALVAPVTHIAPEA